MIIGEFLHTVQCSGLSSERPMRQGAQGTSERSAYNIYIPLISRGEREV